MRQEREGIGSLRQKGTIGIQKNTWLFMQDCVQILGTTLILTTCAELRKLINVGDVADILKKKKKFYINIKSQQNLGQLIKQYPLLR